jgi:hypothetical protein
VPKSTRCANINGWRALWMTVSSYPLTLCRPIFFCFTYTLTWHTSLEYIPLVLTRCTSLSYLVWIWQLDVAVLDSHV